MSDTPRSTLRDGVTALILEKHYEHALLADEAIYWCDSCNVYHIDPAYDWDHVAQVLAASQATTRDSQILTSSYIPPT